MPDLHKLGTGNFEPKNILYLAGSDDNRRRRRETNGYWPRYKIQ